MDDTSLMKSCNGINRVSLDSRLLSKRIIYIDDKEITGELVSNVVKRILVLISESDEKEITIIMDSPGGDIKAGMVLYDLLQSCETPIHIVVAGRAYSMAAVIFAAGKYGRYMLPNSEIMIHQPSLGNPVSGNSTCIESISEKLSTEKKILNKILSKLTGKTEKQIEKATSYDHYFNAEEAVEFGLRDRIIDFSMITGEMSNA